MNGLIPECGKYIGGTFVDCNFPFLMQLVSNVIAFAVEIAFPLSIITFAWAGFTLMLNPANPGKRSDAWRMMRSVAIGFGVLLAAWLIVKLVLSVFLSPDVIKNIPLQGVQ